jgi:hypothetical protein
MSGSYSVLFFAATAGDFDFDFERFFTGSGFFAKP